MNVGAVSAVGSGTAPVYAALSPYLNGVRRTSNAAAAAQLEAVASAKSAAATATAIAARGQAAASITALPPFLNPAIAHIAQQTALGQAITPQVAITPNAQTAAATVTPVPATATPATVTTVSPNAVAPPPQSATNAVLTGDAGLLIQSYGAVALATSPLAFAPLYGLPVTPAVPAVAPVSAYPRVARIDIAA